MACSATRKGFSLSALFTISAVKVRNLNLFDSQTFVIRRQHAAFALHAQSCECLLHRCKHGSGLLMATEAENARAAAAQPARVGSGRNARGDRLAASSDFREPIRFMHEIGNRVTQFFEI